MFRDDFELNAIR